MQGSESSFDQQANRLSLLSVNKLNLSFSSPAYLSTFAKYSNTNKVFFSSTE